MDFTDSRRTKTIQESLVYVRSWFISDVVGKLNIETNYKIRSDFSFLIVNFLQGENCFKIRAKLYVNFQNCDLFDKTVEEHFKKTFELINEGDPEIRQDWTRDGKNDHFFHRDNWPYKTYFSEDWDRIAELNEKLEKKRLGLRTRWIKIKEAKQELYKLGEELKFIADSELNTKLSSAQMILNKAKKIEKKTRSQTFDADMDKFKTEVLRYLGLPDDKRTFFSP